ncbi:5'-nucleotidase domain-containing protein DDB_G0275467-like isoform X3 [Tripterygium wilfordii]|uniref:5'-nucleotidase domain-containing protein DDB_G0275467-like isoform X3 n=1 Tax=Tripterygium wilfordii TaxID=458696 RepID=UPI0018F809D9|nr:5'-nucleotidase domain-containing protein DDB_G0275467-like isoform X3 [Tripterygium wilfordii]
MLRIILTNLYDTRHIGRDQVRCLVGLMDFFCFSEACLIADIVQDFVDAKLEFDACYIYEDVNRAIQLVHRSGLVHRGILSDPHRYLVRNVSIGYGNSWRELFDVVIAKANKPEFYTSEHPFRCYDTKTDTLAFTKVDAFHSDKVYYHGCLKSFLQITKWKGPELIYFGDHLFSNLRGPSKAGWHMLPSFEN